MKDLLAMFNGGGAKKDTGPKFVTKKTVVEEGNVAPGKAFKRKTTVD